MIKPLPKDLKLSKKFVKDPSLQVRNQVGIEKLVIKAFKSIKKDLRDLLKESVRQLQEPTPVDVGGYKDRLKFIIGTKIKEDLEPKLKAAVNKSYKAGVIRSSQFLGTAGIEVEAVFNLPIDQQVISLLEERNLAALEGITDEMEKKILDILTDGAQKGEGIAKIARDIDNQIESISRARAKTFARTETMNAFNSAAKSRFEQHGIQEVMWLTAEDQEVDDVICKPRNRKIYPINDHPDIPAHPNCRCVLLPVIPEVK